MAARWPCITIRPLSRSKWYPTSKSAPTLACIGVPPCRTLNWSFGQLKAAHSRLTLAKAMMKCRRKIPFLLDTAITLNSTTAKMAISTSKRSGVLIAFTIGSNGTKSNWTRSSAWWSPGTPRAHGLPNPARRAGLSSSRHLDQMALARVWRRSILLNKMAIRSYHGPRICIVTTFSDWGGLDFVRYLSPWDKHSYFIDYASIGDTSWLVSL